MTRTSPGVTAFYIDRRRDILYIFLRRGVSLYKSFLVVLRCFRINVTVFWHYIVIDIYKGKMPIYIYNYLQCHSDLQLFTLSWNFPSVNADGISIAAHPMLVEFYFL